MLLKAVQRLWPAGLHAGAMRHEIGNAVFPDRLTLFRAWLLGGRHIHQHDR
jgi:hypothetical protein